MKRWFVTGALSVVMLGILLGAKYGETWKEHVIDNLTSVNTKVGQVGNIDLTLTDLSYLATGLSAGGIHVGIVTRNDAWTAVGTATVAGSGYWVTADSVTSVDNSSVINVGTGTNAVELLFLDNSTGGCTADVFLFADSNGYFAEHLQHSFTADNVTIGGLYGPSGGTWGFDTKGKQWMKIKVSSFTAVAGDNITFKWRGY